MTFRMFWLSGLPLLAGALAAAPLKLETLQEGSRTYRDVTVLGANATDLYFTHAQGLANAKLKYLSPELQARFGYNAEAAATAEKQQTEDHARFIESVGEEIAAEAERNSPAAVAARAWAEVGLADPLGDRSLLNKPAPEITAEKWLGEKPDPKGRFALLLFWASWSNASRQVLPQFNTWHKAHAGDLVVIGISPETERELSQIGELRPEFFTGIDTKNKLANSVGAVTLPYCLLIDDGGIVRYQGHPAALDPRKLQAILTRPAE